MNYSIKFSIILYLLISTYVHLSTKKHYLKTKNLMNPREKYCN